MLQYLVVLSVATWAYNSRYLEMEFGSIDCLDIPNRDFWPSAAATSEAGVPERLVLSTDVRWKISSALMSGFVLPLTTHLDVLPLRSRYPQHVITPDRTY